MIIDAHTHWQSGPAFPELAGTELQLTPLPNGGFTHTTDGVSGIMADDFFDLDKQNRVAEEAGVDVRLITASLQLNMFMAVLDLPSLEIARRINDSGADWMRRAPGRVFAVPSICPFEEAHLAELQRAHTDLGMRGVFVDTSWYVDGAWRNVYLDDPRTEPFWAYAEEHDVPVFLHPPILPAGHSAMDRYKLDEAVGRPADTALSVARLILSGLFDRHPRLRVMAAHMGGALLAVMGRIDFTHRLGYEGLPERERARCERRPSDYLRRNLFVDTMGFWPPHAREAVEVFGADRVLLGTDYGPLPISPAEHVEIVRSLELGAAAEEKILGANADRLFELDLVTA